MLFELPVLFDLLHRGVETTVQRASTLLKTTHCSFTWARVLLVISYVTKSRYIVVVVDYFQRRKKQR